VRTHFVGLALVVAALPSITGQAASATDQNMAPPLISFGPDDTREWFSVNDDVMGGLSGGGIRRTEEGTGLFAGALSLENNGGFASVRTLVDRPDLAKSAGLEIRVRGDGRTYQLRLRDDGSFDGVAHRALFTTRADEWITVRLSYGDFQPTFRGRLQRDISPLDPARIRQVGLMVADKQAGPFALEIETVTPWFEAADGPR